MTPGRVVRVRVNPTDCLTVLDLMKVVGWEVRSGQSFDQLVSIAIKALFESCREQGIVPKRDGFEFSEMMAPFGTPSLRDMAGKVKLAKQISSPHFVAPPVPGTPSKPTKIEDLPQRERVRFEELSFKQQQDPLNFSKEEAMELAEIISKVYD